MKTFAALIVGIVIGGAVMYLLCYARHATYVSGYIVHVERPLMMCVQDIVHTYDDGDDALAEAKVRRLDELWHEHYGDVQETREIYDEIFNLQIESTSETP